MPSDKTRAVLEQELRGVPIEDVFEWIDLENVLGSASIAQVYFAGILSFAAVPKHRWSAHDTAYAWYSHLASNDVT